MAFFVYRTAAARGKLQAARGYCGKLAACNLLLEAVVQAAFFVYRAAAARGKLQAARGYCGKLAACNLLLE
ncbi:MAG: hypothetical protein ACN6QI_25755, partial [Pseudomonas sp.]|uniref:hypothetical protein n=2 Tax=Pseudomonas TaxID=286 RepID=UPI003D0F7FF8